MATKMEPTLNLNEVSRISAGTVVKGEIITQSDIRIDGTLEGKVYSKGRVVVGDKAVVKGDIVCLNVDFCGNMKGNFYVKDTLLLRAGCSVEGDLHVRRLQVELDARFNGNCKMISEAEYDKLASGISGAPAPEVKKPASSLPEPKKGPAK